MEDLPRSPTGRIPQWVLDDAVGSYSPPPAWRTSEPLPDPRGPGRRRRSGRPGGTFLLSMVVVLCLLGIGAIDDGRTLGGVVAAVREITSDGPGAASGTGVDPVLTAPADALPPATSPDLLPPVDGRSHPTPGLGEAPAPLGVPPVPSEVGAYAFSAEQTGPDGTQLPVAWSPCRPIHYVTDPTGAPDGFGAELAEVLAEVSAATGLVFVDDGTTVEPATIDRGIFLPQRYGDRWAPVLIRFATEAEVPVLAGDVAGVASPTHVTDPSTGRAHLVSGVVLLDLEVLEFPRVWGAPQPYVEVLRHELGHLVGLDHVDDPDQVMHPTTTGQRAFQAGDLAGLAQLGRGSCAPGI